MQLKWVKLSYNLLLTAAKLYIVNSSDDSTHSKENITPYQVITTVKLCAVNLIRYENIKPYLVTTIVKFRSEHSNESIKLCLVKTMVGLFFSIDKLMLSY